MIGIQRGGWRSRSLLTDIGLGAMDGLEMSLWCYVYAAIMFSGLLSIYLPVGILSCLVGWVLVSYWVILTSRDPLNIVNLDDQAVVIFGSIAVLLVSSMGDQAGTPRGLATMLFIIAATTLGFSASCYLVGRYRLSRVLELLPFPVVCGFMASIGWLLFNAGVAMATDVYMSPSLLADLREGSRLLSLLLSMGLGAGLIWFTARSGKSWSLPAGCILIVAGYYLAMALAGMSHADQVEGGWLFRFAESAGGAGDMLGTLSLGDIDWAFVVSVAPQMLTILMLAMLYASMTLTGLKAASDEKLDIGEEFHNLSTGNLFCVAACSPPGYTDIVSSSMYREFGASSRWVAVTSSSVGVLVAVFGGAIIGYLPKLLMGAIIFLFAFQTLFDWLYRNVRGFSRTDYAIVLIILGTTVFVSFMQGIGVGIVLTVLLFVVRYSRISAIQSRHTLRNQRSSVERSNAAKAVLRREGDSVVIYSLRGFLFFGTANAILDSISDSELAEDHGCSAILMEMERVTGLDISALNTFAQIKALCDAEGVLLLYSAVPPGIIDKLLAVEAVSFLDGEPMVFAESDFAIEKLEDRMLARSEADPERLSIRDHLTAVIREEEKVDMLLRAMVPSRCRAGENLFEQGDPDTGMYVVEKGSLSASINTAEGEQLRVRKFSPGSLIGELSAYLRDKHRTATVVADEDSVVHHLSRQQLENADHELRACIHELVVTTLAERVSFMNRRLLLERK